MIQKPSDNQCSGSGSKHHLQDKKKRKKRKKTRISRSKIKDMLIVFFYIQGIVTAVWVPSGQTVNQQYLIEVLTKLRKCVRKKRPEL